MNEKTKNVRLASFDWLRMILAFFVIVLLLTIRMGERRSPILPEIHLVMSWLY